MDTYSLQHKQLIKVATQITGHINLIHHFCGLGTPCFLEIPEYKPEQVVSKEQVFVLFRYKSVPSAVDKTEKVYSVDKMLHLQHGIKDILRNTGYPVDQVSMWCYLNITEDDFRMVPCGHANPGEQVNLPQ